MSQSPIHRECFCYITSAGTTTPATSRNPLFIGNAFATELDPPDVSQEVWDVAIPYSSGMLLLLQAAAVRLAYEDLRVAIPYSSGMLLLPSDLGIDSVSSHLSQSPIHRECFCYDLVDRAWGR